MNTVVIIVIVGFIILVGFMGVAYYFSNPCPYCGGGLKHTGTYIRNKGTTFAEVGCRFYKCIDCGKEMSSDEIRQFNDD